MYLAFLLPLVFAFFAFIKKKVTIPGIIAAYLMGVIITFIGGIYAFVALAGTFVLTILSDKLKKSKSENKTLFIDASKECVKVTNNNKLSDENIENIVSVYGNREDKEYFSRLVSNDEIAENDYNLSVSTYVEQEDTREVVDIKVLNAEIEQIVAREQVLRDEIAKIIAEIEGDEPFGVLNSKTERF